MRPQSAFTQAGLGVDDGVRRLPRGILPELLGCEPGVIAVPLAVEATAGVEVDAVEAQRQDLDLAACALEHDVRNAEDAAGVLGRALRARLRIRIAEPIVEA